MVGCCFYGIPQRSNTKSFGPTIGSTFPKATPLVAHRNEQNPPFIGRKLKLPPSPQDALRKAHPCGRTFCPLSSLLLGKQALARISRWLVGSRTDGRFPFNAKRKRNALKGRGKVCFPPPLKNPLPLSGGRGDVGGFGGLFPKSRGALTSGRWFREGQILGSCFEWPGLLRL